MTVIHKYYVPRPFKDGRVDIEVPISSAFLSFGIDGDDDLVMWVQHIDPAMVALEPMVKFRFLAVNTGMIFNNHDVGPYIQTVIMGTTVWHFYWVNLKSVSVGT